MEFFLRKHLFMQYILVRFFNLSAAEKEMLSARLSVTDWNGIEEQERELWVYFEEKKFPAVLIQEIAHDLQLRFEQEEIKPKNWNEEWEHNFQPVIIEAFCCIRAVFHPKPDAVLHDIIITPKMAFGTGHHATTELMIRMMKDMDFQDKKVFDFGTGTGILSVLAEKMGADLVVAVDNDEHAIENAREHLSCNGTRRIRLEKGSAEVVTGLEFDLILANINRNILLENIPSFPALLREGGKALLSGLLIEDAAVIHSAAVREGFLLLDKKEKNGWCALLFEMK
jgi:ribosomal protein L11 methyltransferase